MLLELLTLSLPVFYLLLTYFTSCSSISIATFGQINAGWVGTCFQVFPA